MRRPLNCLPKPQRTYSAQYSCGYDERTVGASRYSAALQHDVRLSLVVRVPVTYGVDTTFSAVLAPYSHADGSLYKVYQVQQMTNEHGLPVTDISLERLEGINADEVISNS